jgi:hypothetical protein
MKENNEASNLFHSTVGANLRVKNSLKIYTAPSGKRSRRDALPGIENFFHEKESAGNFSDPVWILIN